MCPAGLNQLVLGLCVVQVSSNLKTVFDNNHLGTEEEAFNTFWDAFKGILWDPERLAAQKIVVGLIQLPGILASPSALCGCYSRTPFQASWHNWNFTVVSNWETCQNISHNSAQELSCVFARLTLGPVPGVAEIRMCWEHVLGITT